MVFPGSEEPAAALKPVRNSVNALIEVRGRRIMAGVQNAVTRNVAGEWGVYRSIYLLQGAALAPFLPQAGKMQYHAKIASNRCVAVMHEKASMYQSFCQ